MQSPAISDRLRLFKEKKGLTAQAMADATGISRRTLESYMRRENPPLPGLETLGQLAKGLGVSLDWLVLGDDTSVVRDILTARVCAEHGALPVIRDLLSKSKHDQALLVPEVVAREVGAEAARNAVLLVEELMTTGQLVLLTKHLEALTITSLSVKRDALKEQLETLKAELASKPA